MTYYFCLTDENKVQCVDQVDEESQNPREVESMASKFPGVIYFEVE